MLSVNTNRGAVNGLQAMNAVAADMSGIRARLSTGQKIAGAKDNGATWSIAQNLRADIMGRQAIGNSLDRATSVLDLARTGAEQIAEILSDIQTKGAALADVTLDAASQLALRSDITILIKKVDFIAAGTDFGGLNLLVPKTDPPVTLAGASGLAPTLNISAPVDGRASLVQFNYLFHNTAVSPAPTVTIGGTNNDGVYWHPVPNFPGAGSNWAITTRYGDWQNFAAGAPSNVTFQANTSPYPGPPGDYGAELISIVQTPFRTHEHAVDTSGTAGFEMTYRPMTAEWLGLTGLDAASPDTILAVAHAALTQATFNAASLGSEQKAAETEALFNARTSDALTAAVGNLVDADMARDSAALQAAQTRQALSAKALSIANAMPRSILQLFGA